MIDKKIAAIIIPLYFKDEPNHFNECLSSVFDMKGEMAHVFVFCDGEITEKLHDIIKKESHRNNFTVYFRRENKGIAITLNDLIDNVLKYGDFKYIVRMDSDDICLKNRLIYQIYYMEKHDDIDVSGGSCIEFGSPYAKKNIKSLPLEHDLIANDIFKRCPFIHPSVIFRRSIFDKGHRYPVDTPFTEDLALWFQLLSLGFRFANIPEPIIKYRTSSDMIKRRSGFNKAWQELKIRLKYIIILKRYSLKDLFWTFAHFVIRILPLSLYGFIYKKLR